MKTLDQVFTHNLFYRPLSVTPLHAAALALSELLSDSSELKHRKGKQGFC